MTDFQLFIDANGLLKKSIAEYLSVSNAFITQLCNGSRTLPEDKLAQIKANTDWDTSMFKQANLSTSIKAVGRSRIELNSRNVYAPAEESHSVLVLKKEIEMLKAQLAEEKERSAQYWEMIQKLMK